jgi:drug/metabolite transporter (DMT)-like permease
MEASAPTAIGSAAAAEDRRMRLTAIGLMCAAMICFTGLDTSSKWLGARVPVLEIVWARYLIAALVSLLAARPWSRPKVLISRRPGLQTFRSMLLLCSTFGSVLGLHWLQLAESATISFLNPIFVALLAAPLLGERVGRPQIVAIVLGCLGVLIATRPGTSAFQPAVLIALAGVIFNSGYVIATRKLAGIDSSPTTLIWTQAAAVILVTPVLPFVWRWPDSTEVWLIMGGLGIFGAVGHGLLIVAHKFAPAPFLAPFFYTQLIWMIVSGLIVFGDRPPAATLAGAAIVALSGGWLALKERRSASREMGPANVN